MSGDDNEVLLRHLVRKRAAETPDAVAVLHPDGSETTFAALDALVDRRAAACGSPAGRTPVVVPSDATGVATVHGVWRAGGSVVLLSPLLPPSERDRRAAETLRAPAVPGEAAVIFTSGTTGRPKGAVLTFAGIAGALRTIGSGIGLADGRAPTIPARSPSPTFMSLAHIGGFFASLNALYQGKPLLPVARFRAGEVFDLVPRFGLTILRLSPAMLHDLAHWPEDRSLAPVRTASVGSAALSVATRRRFEERYGIPVLDNYGQTEFGGAIAFERYEDVKAGRRPVGSVGRVAPGVEVRIVDAEGAAVETGAVGEIWARAPSALAAYLEDGAVVDPRRNGWVPTGDLGRLDGGGFLYLTGRIRDVIVCGGFNVYPAMVEAVIERHPGVLESAVAGLPDERLGEIPVAAIAVSAANGPVDTVALARSLRDDLAPYEIPRRFLTVTRIPRNDTGKPDRAAILAFFAGPAASTD